MTPVVDRVYSSFRMMEGAMSFSCEGWCRYWHGVSAIVAGGTSVIKGAGAGASANAR